MSLTKTAKSFRKTIKIVGVVMVVYYVLILVIIPNTRDFILNLLVDRNPPNPMYGLLDPLKFQPIEFRGTNPPIVLNTKTGRLPAGLPKKMTVYKFKGIQYSYLAGRGAQTDADVLGFSENELISDLKGKEYRWRSLTSGGVLIINTETRELGVATDLLNKASEYPKGQLNQEIARNVATELFEKLDRIDTNIYHKEDFRVTFGEFAGNRIRETKVAADAQLARVDLYGRVGKGETTYSILGPDAKIGLSWLILKNPARAIRGEASPYNYPFILSNFWDLASETDASYPIITVAEAWKQVLAGKGVPVTAYSKESNIFEVPRAPTVDKILVNSIYLAYYHTTEFQKYMQPIYVFDGKYLSSGNEGGDFVIYYPALTAEWTRKVPASTITTPSPSAPQSTESASPQE